MDKPTEGTRVTLKRCRPNPLFQEWLQELYEDAKTSNSPLQSKLQEALESLSKYPLPLNSGAECRVLKGFDKRLCVFLDRRLDTLKISDQPLDTEDANSQSDNDSPPNGPVRKRSKQSPPNGPVRKRSKQPNGTTISQQSLNQGPILPENADSGPKKTKPRKEYRPAFRSGGYAILMALLDNFKENESNPSMSKEALIEKAQKYSEESFTRRKPESFYTAWSNISRLVTKGLVNHVKGKKAMYSLTEEGLALAILVFEENKDRPTLNDIIFNEDTTSNNSTENQNNQSQPVSTVSTLSNGNGSKTSTHTTNISTSQSSLRSIQEPTHIVLPAGTFDVVLLIDKMETGGASKKNDPTVAQFNKYTDLKHEYRSLKVGDFTWIARHKEKKDLELVLPYVVERKRMDDLGKSIKDGRFHEQKFRLRKCGIKNVIYLAENYGSNKHVGLPLTSLMQALINTRVHDGFKVHVTDSHSNTARFLAMMTKRLTIEYKDNLLVGIDREPEGEELMTFQFFNISSLKSKPLTVTETFIKLLLQLRGISVEKALAITKVYSTPKALIKAYERCENQKQGESLLDDLKYENFNRKVGRAVSKSIYQFFVKPFALQ